MEVVSYLGDTQLGSLQQEGGLHEKHLIDIVDNCAASDLTDYAGEIDGRNMKQVGVERDVVVFYKVAGQQTDKANEDFLNTLGRLTVYDGTILGILQVKQEYGVEHPQYLTFIDMVGMKRADDFAHFRD